jgi:two-component system, LytTR family, response regulator AlgR
MKIIIADDEPLARERLQALLADVPGAEVVGEAGNGREAITLAAERDADIVLLDIAMPELDGLEAARHLSQLKSPPAVIFCTAYDAHALAAFEASAVDYLVKPVRRDRLRAALERAQRYNGERAAANGADGAEAPASSALPVQRTHLCARMRGSLKLVAVSDVLYFLAEDKYVVVKHAGGEVLVEESLKALEHEFEDRFVRIHRNCLVAIERLAGLKRTTDGRVFADVRGIEAPLEVSRRNLPGLRKLVKTL